MPRYRTVHRPVSAFGRRGFAPFIAPEASTRREDNVTQRGVLNNWEDEGGSVENAPIAPVSS